MYILHQDDLLQVVILNIVIELARLAKILRNERKRDFIFSAHFSRIDDDSEVQKFQNR